MGSLQDKSNASLHSCQIQLVLRNPVEKNLVDMEYIWIEYIFKKPFLNVHKKIRLELY